MGQLILIIPAMCIIVNYLYLYFQIDFHSKSTGLLSDVSIEGLFSFGGNFQPLRTRFGTEHFKAISRFSLFSHLKLSTLYMVIVSYEVIRTLLHLKEFYVTGVNILTL